MATGDEELTTDGKEKSESKKRMDWMRERLPHIAYGGDYNPEQWTPAFGYEGESVWLEDMRLMRLAGVNVATIAVFSWVTLQPDEHTYTFEWLDRVMDLLAENKIFASLATATAAQPAWLSAAYPDVLPVNEKGLRRHHGERQNYCPTSPDFRRLAKALVEHLAKRYKEHPALLLWHISNEYGPSCYCDRCAAQFRVWLKDRYGSLDEVNSRWTTAFWSHTYTTWEQIEPPSSLGEHSVQGLSLDYSRFMSDMNLECYLNEANVLREITPGVPITTNFMRFHKPLDYFAWAPHLDVISWDSYPSRTDHPSTTALVHDLMRGLKDGQSWMLMEQTPSQVQWKPNNPLKRPDILSLWSYQAVAHGSDAVMYFQWRQSRGSAEKYHGAVVSHAGHEHTRVFGEVATLGAELDALESGLLGSKVPARVAILFSWTNWWNVEYTPGPSSDLRYIDEVQRYYTPLWERNIPVDVVSPDHDLSGYDLVIAPLLNMVTTEQSASIERYVENGGTFLTTFFSGVVDDSDRAWLGGYPGPLRKTLGIWVEEFDPLEPDMSNSVAVPEKSTLHEGSYNCDFWCDILHLEGAEALATFEKDFYAGSPAITQNHFGKGRALYVATRPEHALVANLMGSLLDDLGIKAPLEAPEGVEVTLRQAEGQSYIFVLNHNDFAVCVTLPGHLPDLLTGQMHEHQLTLPSHKVAILVA